MMKAQKRPDSALKISNARLPVSWEKTAHAASRAATGARKGEAV